MAKETVIKIENLGKKYKIGEKEKYFSLRDTIVQTFRSPWQLITGKRTLKKPEFWALKDISFEVKKGEVIGVIGRNGAGKTTLLKILSKIAEPTTGRVILKGKVASLLEVGTGFHSELTGRENIYLNGAILGMTKKAINRKFNNIAEFSGVQKFLDTPAKRYSSGMYVRLAFAVAAHLEPEILLVDEVLAVGDVEFQKKCLSKMDEITKTAGRTILFVSHNMGAVQSLCRRCILLEDGRIKMIGETKQVVVEYLKIFSNLTNIPIKERKDRKGSGLVKINNLSISNQEKDNVIRSFDRIRIFIELDEAQRYSYAQFKIAFLDAFSRVLFRVDTDNISRDDIIDNTVIIESGEVNLAPTFCTVNIGLFIDGQISDYIQNIVSFDILSNQREGIKNYSGDLKSTILVGNKFLTHNSI